MASRKEYEMQFKLNSQLGSSFSGSFQSAQKELAALQQQVESLNKSQSDIKAYQKQQESISKTEEKLRLLQQQYDNIQKEIEQTGEFSADLQNKLLVKQQQIDKTTASMDRQTEKLDKMGEALKEAGVDMDDLGQSSAQLADRIDELKKEQEEVADGAQTFGDKASQAFGAVHEAIVAAGIATALKEVYEYFADCSQASMDFESAMTGVAKTTDLTDEELEAMSTAIKDLSTEIPATTDEIASVAEAAGQLGIQKEALLDFTETMVMLGTATNLTADEAATALARFANITGMSANNYDRLGATIVGLGNNFATTESEITAMATRLASAGTLAGMTEAEILALSTAMSSVGIEAEAGGTAMTQTLSAIESAVENGGDTLYEFARIAGMSSAEFVQAWDDNAVGALTSFIRGLGNLDAQGESAVLTLDELGLSGVRQSNMLKSLALAADQMDRAVAMANQEWTSNTALLNEAGKRYATTQSQLTMAQNAYKNLTVAIGDAYNPVLREAYALGTEALGVVTEYVEENPAAVNAVTAFATVMGLVTAGLAAYTIGAKVAKIATTALTATIPGVNAIMGISLAVAGITAAVSGLATAAHDEAVPSVDELTQASQGLQEAMDESSAAYEDAVSSTMAAADVADLYIEKLKEMEAAGVDTEEEHKEYHNTLSLLCQVVPELAEYIDLETDTIQGGTDALEANTEAWKRNAIQQAQQERMTALYKQYSDVLIEVKKNEVALKQAKDERSIAETRFNEISAETTKILLEGGELTDEQTSELSEASNAWLQAGSTVQAYQKAIDEGNAALAAAEEEFGVTEQAIEAMNEELLGGTEIADAATEQSFSLKEAISGVMEKAEELADAYEEAYDAAYESVSGQYSLWDDAAEVVATSAGTINAALESQTTYWQNYNANLQSLSDRGKDIEGLSGMLASFADGSADSVNAVAGMASASDEDLAAMVKNWQALQEEQNNVSDNIAELKTDFTNEMDKLGEDLAADIDAMDLCDEATAAGEATLQGYIDAATGMMPQVQAAYQSVANAAIAALYGKGIGSSSGAGVPPIYTWTVPAAYAGGTRSADRGFAMVGERGPELVYFGGGEQVFTAEETASMQRGFANDMQIITIAPDLMQALSSYGSNAVYADMEGRSGSSVPVNVVFQIDGNVSSDTIDLLHTYGDEFADRVREVIEDVQAENDRRVYR